MKASPAALNVLFGLAAALLLGACDTESDHPIQETTRTPDAEPPPSADDTGTGKPVDTSADEPVASPLPAALAFTRDELAGACASGADVSARSALVAAEAAVTTALGKVDDAERPTRFWVRTSSGYGVVEINWERGEAPDFGRVQTAITGEKAAVLCLTKDGEGVAAHASVEVARHAVAPIAPTATAAVTRS